MHVPHVSICAHTIMYMFTHIYTLTHACTHIVHMYTHIQAHSRTRMYTESHTQPHLHAHNHMYIYSLNTHTQTQVTYQARTTTNRCTHTHRISWVWGTLVSPPCESWGSGIFEGTRSLRSADHQAHRPRLRAKVPLRAQPLLSLQHSCF